MSEDAGRDLLRWVREGEHLFGLALKTLSACHETDETVTRLIGENQRLRQENQVLREQLAALRAERLEVADTLQIFAEHVTRLATIAIERLAARRAGVKPATRASSSEDAAGF